MPFDYPIANVVGSPVGSPIALPYQGGGGGGPVFSVPFAFFPCDDTTPSSVLAETGGAIVDATVIQPDNDPFVTAGQWTGDGADVPGDSSAAWSVDATLLSILDFWSGATNGTGGQSLLVTFTLIYDGAWATGDFLILGSMSANNAWRLQVFSPNGDMRITSRNATVNATGTLFRLPAGPGTHDVAIWLDAQAGDCQAWLAGSAQTIIDVPGIIAAWDGAAIDVVTATLFGRNTAAVTGAPTVANTLVGGMKNLMLVDTTTLGASQVAQIVNDVLVTPDYQVPTILGGP